MLKDMGKKAKPLDTALPSENKKERIDYPSFNLSGDRIIDELKEMKIEDMCRLEVVVKKVGDNIDNYDNEHRVELQIHKLGYLAKAGKKSFDEYDKMNEEEKEKYDKESIEDKEEDTEDKANE